jgi:SAM-dependent methyltransferase
MEKTAPLPPPRIPVGEAKSSKFFDDYPRLAMSRRMHMNLRYDAIIHQNRDVLNGARVLDLACSEGSYSFGALHVGAAHVLGIESREDKVVNANGHFEALGAAADRYRFIAGDVFQTLAAENPQVDVVMCLGYLYHTLRYPELLHRIRATGAEVVIIDGEVAVSDEAIVRLIEENVDMKGNATRDEYSAEKTVLSGRPSVPALEKMLGVYGFAVERHADWAAIFRDNPEMTFPEYSQGRRVTVVCRRTDDRTWHDGASRR